MKRVIGVDIGGTHIRVGIVHAGKVYDYIKRGTPSTKKEILDVLEKMISDTLYKNKEIKSIGVACPGPLKNGFIKNTPNLALKNFDLKKFLEKKFKKKVIIENDAKCVAISEIKYGTKKNNFIVVTLGTGIGGGIVIDRKIYKGKGNAGEIGHMIVGDGKDIEYFWKKWSAKMRKEYGKGFLIKDLIKQKTGKSKKLLKELYIHLGRWTGTLVSAFDPEEIVFMGGVREGGKDFIDGVVHEAKKFTIIEDFPHIHWSRIEHPGVLGAGELFD